MTTETIMPIEKDLYLNEEKRITDLMKVDGRKYGGDVFRSKGKGDDYRCISIGYELIGKKIVFTMPLQEAKELVKKYQIKRIIDEDNNNGYIQSIYNLDYVNHDIPQYTIKRSIENDFENHSMSNPINEVGYILMRIKKGELDIDKVLSQINK